MSESVFTKAEKVFDMYAPYIKDYIYKSSWQTLRSAQIDAGDVIFNADANLVISSATASGKTEAAFFPILSLLEKDPSKTIAVLYVAPTKALINDQFDRIADVIRESDVTVTKWHGDASLSSKQKLLKSPCGILQITPESLESILLNHSSDILKLFGDLRFIIFDEIHTMLSSDRGSQVKCAIERISRAIGYSPRVIALSATLGDIQSVADSITNSTKNHTAIVELPSDKIHWKLMYETFNIADASSASSDLGLDYIYRATQNKKAIIFSNSREETEYICSSMRQICRNKGELDRFYIHHGNLSASIREETERAIKDDGSKAVACATVTLELGIDIGKLERIINVEAPNSVASFLQRLGRSGRRGQPAEMLAVFREETPLPSAHFFEFIPWHLLQMIAVSQLYINERFVEPVYEKKYPFSLLFHQTLSILASNVELSPKQLAQRVLSLSAFSRISREDYKELLISMIKASFIEQTEEKTLIVGVNGEKIVNNYKFYAVFSESIEYSVKCGTVEIGTISNPLPVGDSFALAGKTWEVAELDLSSRIIYVKKTEGKMNISWPGNSGTINTKIIENIRKVLLCNEEYKYLSQNATNRLLEARNLAQKSCMLNTPIVSLGANNYVFFHWLGTKGARALKKVLQVLCADVFDISNIVLNSCYYIQFKMERGTPNQLLEFLKNIDFGTLNFENFIDDTDVVSLEKYDKYIPKKLLNKAFCYDRLDLPELEKACRRKFKNE